MIKLFSIPMNTLNLTQYRTIRVKPMSRMGKACFASWLHAKQAMGLGGESIG